MQKLLYIFFISFLIFSCKVEVDSIAQEVINKTIEVSGGEKYNQFELEFDFRDKHYKAIRNNGKFQYQREFNNNLGKIKDVLTNDGFQRFINNELAKIPDSMAVKYTASVNSVHYFAILPYGLNDDAVNKISLGEVTIKNTKYHKIKVTFNQNGGGEDYEDVFVYWINNKTFKVDYLAYSYKEFDGVGSRFREAYNERIVNGLRFVDYNNYKSENTETNVLDLAKHFEAGRLKLLSKIELKNIEVK